MSVSKYVVQLISTLSVLLIVGCATTPYEGEGRNKSDMLLTQQLSDADRASANAPNGRIIFAGFAPNSQSKAFRNDVESAEKLVRTLDPNAIVFKLGNPTWGQDALWPYATAENMSQVLAKVTSLSRPQDKVVLLITTHGNVNRLSINFGEKEYPNIDSLWLSRNLLGLRGKPTLLVISACFSGSFVDPLAGPSRIILTASAKDKNSFGCAFHDPNTYFIDALINQSDTTGQSIVQLMTRAKTIVAAREEKSNLVQSDPQIRIGNATRDWANQPLKSWLKPNAN